MTAILWHLTSWIILEGVDGLDDMQRSMIKANHTTNLTALQGYHQKVSDSVRSFYDGVSKTSLQLDNHLQFAIELLSHVDVSMARLAKNKLLLTLFRSRARGVYVFVLCHDVFSSIIDQSGLINNYLPGQNYFRQGIV